MNVSFYFKEEPALQLPNRANTQLTFTFSKSAIETLEKGVKYVKVNDNDVIDVVLVFLMLTLNIFYLFLVFLLLTLNR